MLHSMLDTVNGIAIQAMNVFISDSNLYDVAGNLNYSVSYVSI